VGAVVLDADVIIGFLDPADPNHHRAVEALRSWLGAGHTLLIPASVYAEILVHPLQLGLEETIDAFLDESGVRVVPVDRPLARRAASLRAKHASLRLPDAFVLATGLAHGAELLTFDQRLQRIIDQAADGDK
jgi:predicted nucleic acid-binding protein